MYAAALTFDLSNASAHLVFFSSKFDYQKCLLLQLDHIRSSKGGSRNNTQSAHCRKHKLPCMHDAACYLLISSECTREVVRDPAAPDESALEPVAVPLA